MKLRSAHWWVPAVVVLVVAIGVAATYFMTHNTAKVAAGSVCSDALFASTKDAVNLATNIQAKHDYAKDPNCLFYLAKYQIFNSEYTQAKSTIAKLKAIAGPNQKFSPKLGADASIDSLDKLLQREDNPDNAAFNGGQGQI